MSDQYGRQSVMMQQSVVETPHPISIKLMRLKKPDFSLTVPILPEKTDALGDYKLFYKTPNYVSDVKSMYGNDIPPRAVQQQQQQQKEDKLIEIPGLQQDGNERAIIDRCIIYDTLGYNDAWCLPSAPGAIYVGEHLKCYISLHNESYKIVQNISVTAELVTGKGKTTKQTLLDISSTPLDQLGSKTNKDFIIEHPLTSSDDIQDDEDKTVLTCLVSYYDPEEGRVRSFRKHFPFKVYDPLGMKVKVNTFGSHVFVQLDLQNLTQTPSLYIESVKFEPNFGYELMDQSVHNASENYFEHPLLRGESKRFLFELVPNQKNRVNALGGAGGGVTQNSVFLGKISLQWKNTMGESGMLLTNPIPHKLIPKQDLEASIVGFTSSIPDEFSILSSSGGSSDAEKFTLYTPFYAVCEISNYSKDVMDLSIHLEGDKMYPLAINGSSLQLVGELQPSKSRHVFIPLFPLQRGAHLVAGKGILVKDKRSQKAVALSAKPIMIQ